MNRRDFFKSAFIFTGALWLPKTGILRSKPAEARLPFVPCRDSIVFNFAGMPDGAVSALSRGTVTSGALSWAPTLGSEMLANPGMEGEFTNGLAQNWQNYGSHLTPAQETIIIHSGANSQKLVASGSPGNFLQDVIKGNGYLGNWYLGSAYVYLSAGSITLVSDSPGAWLTPAITVSTIGSWINPATSGRYISTSAWAGGNLYIPSGTTVYVDDFSVKQLSLPSLMSLHKFWTGKASVSVEISNLAAGMQAGLILGADSDTNPQNFLHVNFNGNGSLKFNRVDSGVYTQLYTGVQAFYSNDWLKLTYNNDSYGLLYYKASVGSWSQLGSDYDLWDFTPGNYHGMFSTNSGNTFSKLIIERV